MSEYTILVKCTERKEKVRISLRKTMTLLTLSPFYESFLLEVSLLLSPFYSSFPSFFGLSLAVSKNGQILKILKLICIWITHKNICGTKLDLVKGANHITIHCEIKYEGASVETQREWKRSSPMCQGESWMPARIVLACDRASERSFIPRLMDRSS